MLVLLSILSISSHLRFCIFYQNLITRHRRVVSEIIQSLLAANNLTSLSQLRPELVRQFHHPS
jgi:hypothetical protein